MSTAAYTVTRTADIPLERLFDAVVAEDVLPKVLHRYGPVPAVRETRDLTGPWTCPGSSRTVVLQNGRTARETLRVFERPHRFEYCVDCLRGPLGPFVDHAIGCWVFDEAPVGSRFTWTYTFVSGHRTLTVPLRLFARLAWG